MQRSVKSLIAFISIVCLSVVITGNSAQAKCKGGRKPVIGIVGSYNGEKGSVTANRSYIEPVYRAGAIPVIVSYCESESMAKALLSTVDGILVTGGSDVVPAWYGEEILNETVSCTPSRDSSEMFLIKEAVREKKAILGICRGHQIVNVALGGTLYQDIPSQIPDCLVHRQKEPSSVTTQEVFLEPDSYIAKLMGTTTLNANSHHHQAVKAVGKGLRIVGRASDGVSEICEGFPKLNILTIQFHPEKLVAAGDDYYMPVFYDFVRRAAGK